MAFLTLANIFMRVRNVPFLGIRGRWACTILVGCWDRGVNEPTNHYRTLLNLVLQVIFWIIALILGPPQRGARTPIRTRRP